MIETRAGQPLSARDVRDSIAHLFSLGRFEDVRVYAAPAADGVALRIELLPLHSVGRIAFTGTIGLDEGLLRRTIAERFGVTPAAARAADVARTLSALYRDHGYLKARIEPHATVEHREERTTLTFEIDAGPRLTVSKVRFDGKRPRNPGAGRGTARVRCRTAATIVRAWPRALPRTSPPCGGAGYYEAQGDHALQNVSDDGRSAELVVHIDGGARIIVQFEGDPVPPKVRADLVPIGREASVDEDLLEDAARALAEHFRSQGYRDAEVTYTRSPGEDELAIVFRVARGRCSRWAAWRSPATPAFRSRR